MNADDDVLAYLLADRGRVVDEYDSNPGYDTGPAVPAIGGDPRLLSNAFSRPGAVERVRHILHASSPTFELDRHQALVDALGLPTAVVGMGYRYISDGEANDAGLTNLQRIGRAPEP